MNTAKKNRFPTSDRLIRNTLKRKIASSSSTKYSGKLIEEFVVNNGAVRADMVLINSSMHGYEFKSDLDSLSRLPRQIEAYNLIFDKITIVVGKSHLYEVIKMIPDWWGITIAKTTNSNKEVKLYSIRKPERNKEQDLMAIASLLWRDESLSILEEIGEANGVRSKNKCHINSKLITVLNKRDLKIKVRTLIRSRKHWRAD